MEEEQQQEEEGVGEGEGQEEEEEEEEEEEWKESQPYFCMTLMVSGEVTSFVHYPLPFMVVGLRLASCLKIIKRERVQRARLEV